MVTIIDGNNLACRCYFAIKSLTTSKGETTNLIYGVLASLRSYVSRFGQENHYFIAWDSEGQKERHILYPNYKADRKKFPDEFYTQLENVRQLIAALNVQQFKLPYVEADDVIATLALKSRKAGHRVLIVSSDHDFEQLISKSIKVLSPSLAQSKEVLKDRDYVVDTYGLEPTQMTEFMAILGDDSDNIAGIVDVGEKTVTRLLLANGGMNGVIQAGDKLKIISRKGELTDATDVLKKKISTSIEQILLNYKLVKLNTNLDVEPIFKPFPGINIELVTELFKKYEFNKFLSEIEEWQNTFSAV